jgi:hypothetical protein
MEKKLQEQIKYLKIENDKLRSIITALKREKVLRQTR